MPIYRIPDAGIVALLEASAGSHGNLVIDVRNQRGAEFTRRPSRRVRASLSHFYQAETRDNRTTKEGGM